MAAKKHPGFKTVQKKVARKQGVSMKRAGAIVASGARKASKKAVAANPRLKRVSGVKPKKKSESKPVPLGGVKRTEDKMWGPAKPVKMSGGQVAAKARAQSSRRNQPSAAQKRKATQNAKDVAQDRMFRRTRQINRRGY